MPSCSCLDCNLIPQIFLIHAYEGVASRVRHIMLENLAILLFSLTLKVPRYYYAENYARVRQLSALCQLRPS